jgi:taurine dioxygenase
MTVLDIQKNDKPLGHRLCGLDLAETLSHEQFQAINAAYEAYGVVVIPGQDLDPGQQVAFSRRFSELVRFPMEQFNLPAEPDILVVSNIIENGKPIGVGDAGRCWHTDMWYTDNPPRGSLLYALEVPHDGDLPLGDTMFASTSHAYDTLSEDMKTFLEGRWATFSHDYHVGWRAARSGKSEGAGAQKTREKASIPDNRHPLVKTHPVTGRKCLYISEGAIVGVDGMSHEDAMALVDELLAHSLSDDVVYRHSWTKGDLVMWDNYSCLHCAIGDFPDTERRRMYRTTIK